MSDPEVAEVELTGSTLDSVDQPTNQPTVPTRYVSVRVTLTHDQWDVIEQCINDVEWYISYAHLGKKWKQPPFPCAPARRQNRM